MNKDYTAAENMLYGFLVMTKGGKAPWNKSNLIVMLENIVKVLESEMGAEKMGGDAAGYNLTPVGMLATTLLTVYFDMPTLKPGVNGLPQMLVLRFAQELLKKADTRYNNLWPASEEESATLQRFCYMLSASEKFGNVT